MFNIIQHKEVLTTSDISERIKYLRQTKGITQEQLGNVLGVVKSTISLYESGKSCPNDQIKTAICKYFDVNMDYLLGISDDDGTKDSAFSKDLVLDGKCRTAFFNLVEKRGMSLDDISRITGLSMDILKNWFLSDIPTISQLYVVSECLNTSIDYLLGKSEFQNPINEDDAEILSYFYKLNKIDRIWILGKITDFIKGYGKPTSAPVAEGENGMPKASGK